MMAQSKRICSIDGCGKPHDSKGHCKKHARERLRREKGILPRRIVKLPGEPEKPKRVPTVRYPSVIRWLREEVAKSSNECIEWPFRRDRDGYGRMKVAGRDIPAHRYSLIHYEGPPPTERHYACHQPIICHNPSCVNPRHLRWATPQDNVADKNRDGTMNRGVRQGLSKLTPQDIYTIRSSTLMQKELAKILGVSIGAISAVVRGKSWSWLK